MYLSKSDFKVARTCGTKLYYKKLRYPSNVDDDPYLEFLADGGYMIETIAKLLFPDGEEIDFQSADGGVALTKQALKKDSATLFDASVVFGQLFARLDILEKRGNQFRLIEVKAKGFDPTKSNGSPFRGKRGGIESGWRPYLEDIAFQTYVVRNAIPGAIVTPCLCLVDKSKVCGVETSFEKFQLIPRANAPDTNVFGRPQVKFLGDVSKLTADPFVTVIEVSEEVDELMPEVVKAAEQFVATLRWEKPQRIDPVVGVRCKKCEYRLDEPDKSGKDGFRECWGKRADASPHLLDFYQVSRLGKNGQVAAQMIADGKCGIRDVSEADLRGEIGKRQAIQLKWTLEGKEFISSELKPTLDACEYPLHFIDFEASRSAIPYHPGMHPYEQVAFQWSCHTIKERGTATLDHDDWINVDQAYPNFEFARTLRNAIDGGGTVFVWSPFERVALRDIRRQLTQYQEDDPDLVQWLEGMIADNAPLLDLCELAKEHYFHPRMAGSTSIKDVLPAIWFESEAIRKHPWFSDYLRVEHGEILEPYKTLKPLPFGDDAIGEEAEAVREGTGAIRTYQEMMFGLRRSDASFRDAQRGLLLNYCELDTAAMVMIWMHWMNS